jgi:hypothetical protein
MEQKTRSAACWFYAVFFNSEVQNPHFVALIGMVIWQKLHSLVVGTAGGAASSFLN